VPRIRGGLIRILSVSRSTTSRRRMER
jgi:hypothetical protein